MNILFGFLIFVWVVSFVGCSIHYYCNDYNKETARLLLFSLFFGWTYPFFMPILGLVKVIKDAKLVPLILPKGSVSQEKGSVSLVER